MTRLLIVCDGHGCTNALVVAKADADKLPARWTCDICLQEQRDQYVNAQAMKAREEAHQ